MKRKKRERKEGKKEGMEGMERWSSGAGKRPAEDERRNTEKRKREKVLE